MQRSVRTLVTGLAGSGLMATLLLASPAAAGTTVTRVVDDDGHASRLSCDSTRTAPRRIQRAVDLSGPGDTILVCPGTYRETVSVSGSAKAGLVIRAVRAGRAVIKPPAPVIGTPPEPAGSSPLFTVASPRVSLRGLRFVAPTGTDCVPLPTVVQITPAGDRALLRGLRIAPAGTDTLGQGSGCGLGVGIDVSDASNVSILESRVRDFKVAGIVVHGDAAGATVQGNAVAFEHAGYDETPGGCEYGLHVYDGARAAIIENAISALDTAGLPGGTPSLCYGIFVYEGDAASVIRANTVTHVEYGMDLEELGPGVVVARNRVLDSRTQGFYVFGVQGMELRYNYVRRAGIEGISLTGNTSGSFIHDNDFRGNGGADCSDDSAGQGSSGAPHYTTLNSWVANLGADPYPAGICTLP